MEVKFIVPVETENGKKLDILISCGERKISRGARKPYAVLDIMSILLCRKDVRKAIIKELVLPSEYDGLKIRGIREDVFSGTGFDDMDYELGRNGNTIENLVISEGIEDIFPGAFDSCYVKNVHWPSSCTYISSSTFTYSKIESIENVGGVTAVGEKAFYNCRNLRLVSYLASCKQIQDSAFCNCTNLEGFIWPEECPIIPANCFSACMGMTHIEIKGPIDKVERNAFALSRIKELDFSNGLFVDIDETALPEGVNIIKPFYQDN